MGGLACGTILVWVRCGFRFWEGGGPCWYGRWVLHDGRGWFSRHHAVLVRLTQTVVKRLGVERVKGMPYHPESQGAVERENDATKAGLAKMIAMNFGGIQELDGTRWTPLLPLVIANRNATPRRKLLGQTPHFVLHGRPAPIAAGGGIPRTAPVDPRTLAELQDRIVEKQRTEKDKARN